MKKIILKLLMKKIKGKILSLFNEQCISLKIIIIPYSHHLLTRIEIYIAWKRNIFHKRLLDVKTNDLWNCMHGVVALLDLNKVIFSRHRFKGNS